MISAATITSVCLAHIYETLPCYGYYRKHYDAQTDESTYRLALAGVMRNIGDRMLNYIESKGLVLDPRKVEIIDTLVDGIGECLKIINRQGKIKILQAGPDGIANLKSVDNLLIMMLEKMILSVDSLVGSDPALFPINVRELTISLDTYSELIEERNRMLNMGWESEIKHGFCDDLGWQPT